MPRQYLILLELLYQEETPTVACISAEIPATQQA
jgi:hypothetical protein